MTNKEVHELVEKAIENYSRSTNTLFSLEIKNVRDDVRDLVKEFKEMNGRVREVYEWKSHVEGKAEGAKEITESKNKEKMSNWNVVSIVLYAIMTLFVILGYNKNRNQDKDMNVIENILREKQDRTPDSTTRAFNPEDYGFMPITEDTPWLNQLYKSTDELLKQNR